ncbi:MAG TPA: sensor histidine kinase, partial [Catalimonadaceae bacterium]|nr:sensor histidine kinase [Catalimonadaceae bacterium]
NLISNAIKFSPEGKTITIKLAKNKKQLILAVSDEGMGIPEEDKEHLFSRFFRARNAETIKGTGLGLHIVQRYVELMGGEIQFESKIGEGSTFLLFFPQE